MRSPLFKGARPSREDGLITGFNVSPRRRRPLMILTILDRLGIDFISGGITYIQQNIDEVVDSVVGVSSMKLGFKSFNTWVEELGFI